MVSNPILTVDSVDTLMQAIAQIKKAQAIFATYSQEQVDAIFRAAALAANHARIPLAKAAVAETGMGVVEDKVTKNHYASEFIYNQYKDTKTCGIIEDDPAFGIRKIAEPMGVIAAVIPTTNPTSTAVFKGLLALKTRNGIIFAPHPRAKNCTGEAVRVIYEAAVKAGAPEGIMAWITAPSLEMSNEVMSAADLILATGGPGMVRAAYSSGKPAIGVGAGNVPAVFHRSADVKLSVSSVILSKTFDNGMICSSEQSVIVDAEIYDAVRAEFALRGAYFLTSEETEKVRKTIVINGALNAKIVGQTAPKIAKMAGVTVPNDTKLLIGEVESVDFSEEFAHEKLSPVLAMYKYETFDEAIAKADRLIHDSGYGHTVSLYICLSSAKGNIPSGTNAASAIENTPCGASSAFADRIRFEQAMKTCRILINSPSAHGAIGDLYNFKLAPSLTLGCGSWGGNSVSENVGVRHLLNIKTVAERRENMLWFRTPEKVYHKKGSLGVALMELKSAKKKVFIVTDEFLYKNNYTKNVERYLDEMGIRHYTFYNVQPDPTLSNALDGVKAMRNFAPDCVLAFGGGSPIDAAKIMWVLYEHPEVNFHDLAMRFMDIRKRIYPFPKMGSKANFIAVPTTAGSGSEVTPFAVITDEKTGIKYPLADYELLPNIAIIDIDYMMDMPPGLTAASGIDVLTHALEAYASMLATDYTDGMALTAMRSVFTYLPIAYADGKNELAREKMANASTVAGMAFANAFLGVCHSMAHKLGAAYDLAHGVANALMINEVIRFNATEKPNKQGAFSQYPYPNAVQRYGEIADYLGLQPPADFKKDGPMAKVAALTAHISELKAKIGIHPTIREYGIDEADFLAKVDDLAEKAFDDQCTGANPRYPLISEIKQMYLNAYYGTNTNDTHYSSKNNESHYSANEKGANL